MNEYKICCSQFFWYKHKQVVVCNYKMGGRVYVSHFIKTIFDK
jgi:hypothetical protein